MDHAVIRLILSDPRLGQEILEQGNLFVGDNRVLEIPLDSQPGQLARLAGALTEAKLNIDYAYGSNDGTHGMLYLRVDDPDRADEVVSSFLSS